MTVTVTHAFVCNVADDAAAVAAGEVLPSHWDATHTISGLGTGVLAALGVNTGSAGAFVVNGGALGTPSSGTLTSATGLPISTGLTGAGTGVLTALGVNVGTAGAFVVNGGALGTPSSGVLTNATGTASGLTAGHVTTNANLTGNVTSVGNATTLDVTPAYAFIGLGSTAITAPTANTTALTVSGFSAGTADTHSLLNLSGTWNVGSGNTAGTAIQLNITSTSSAATSALLDLQVGGVSQFKVLKNGDLTIATAGAGYNLGSGGNVGSIYQRATGVMTFYQGADRMELSTTQLTSTVPIALGAGVTSGDVFWSRGGAATHQLGNANAASPVNQIVQGQGSRAGTDTNVGGASVTIMSGAGTGTGAVSTLTLQSPVAVGSGTGAQTQTTGLIIKVGTAVLTSYTVANLPTAGTAGAGATAFVTDASTTLILGLGGTVTGGGANKVPVFSDGSNWIYG